eukprot:CAMPEP_0204531470 /NCGR_PEP_ID=MMETSP0661-20131031/11185_1 /ASSEMBLY_ACC=CAM_ASM_000606 /TAXON_ID=109239 /ORGANISM="Alexandrium margalefi, Strain AMGDE01CS-322" /LENGTH=311 /DNA_ID=CAMNT_0051537623 /DNA_START=15 /DNA_END=950 /DNA_ORIENTATION=-
MAILVLLERDVWGSARPSMDSKLVHASWQSRACPGQLVLATAPTSRSGVSTCPSTCASSRSPSSGASSCPSPGRSSPPRCGARSHRADGSSGASAYRRHRGIFWRPPIGEAGGYRATHSHHVIDGPPEQLPQQFSMVDSSDKSTDTYDLTGPWEPMGFDTAANGSADASNDLGTDFGADAVQPEDLREELPEDQLVNHDLCTDPGCAGTDTSTDTGTDTGAVANACADTTYNSGDDTSTDTSTDSPVREILDGLRRLMRDMATVTDLEKICAEAAAAGAAAAAAPKIQDNVKANIQDEGPCASLESRADRP